MPQYTDNPMMRASLGIPNKAVLAAYLTCVDHDSNHRKFYQIYVVRSDDGWAGKEWEVVCKYGRIGTDGQTTTHQFPRQTGAVSKAENLIRQKLSPAKGYVDGFSAMPVTPVAFVSPESEVNPIVPSSGVRKIMLRKRGNSK
jgi:predicted DNA-binding WGR domain protein